jgi:hypothetical protein
MLVFKKAKLVLTWLFLLLFHNQLHAEELDVKLWDRLLYVDHSSNKFLINTPGFLMSYPNPSIASEIILIKQNLLKSKESAINIHCRFPARVNLILEKHLSDRELEHFNHLLPHGFSKNNKCLPLQEYYLKAPVDSFEYVFASKNYLSVTSMMGHGFLMGRGIDNEGHLRQHTYSFFADVSNAGLFSLLYDSFIGGMSGKFALRPFTRDLLRYLNNEKREVWSLELKLSAKEVKILQNVLWELKDSEPEYFFQSFNCATLSLYTLSIVYPEILVEEKLFVSPLDIYKALESQDLVKQTNVRFPHIEMEQPFIYGIATPSQELQDSVISLRLNSSNDIVLNFLGASHYFHTPQARIGPNSELKIGNIEYNLSLNKLTELGLYDFVNTTLSGVSSSFFIGAKRNDFDNEKTINPSFSLALGKTFEINELYYTLLAGFESQPGQLLNLSVQQYASTKLSSNVSISGQFEWLNDTRTGKDRFFSETSISWIIDNEYVISMGANIHNLEKIKVKNAFLRIDKHF